MCLIAIKNNFNAIQYVPEELRTVELYLAAGKWLYTYSPKEKNVVFMTLTNILQYGSVNLVQARSTLDILFEITSHYETLKQRILAGDLDRLLPSDRSFFISFVARREILHQAAEKNSDVLKALNSSGMRSQYT